MKIRSTYTIEKEVVKALRDASKGTRRSMSSIVEQAIEEFVFYEGKIPERKEQTHAPNNRP